MGLGLQAEKRYSRKIKALQAQAKSCHLFDHGGGGREGRRDTTLMCKGVVGVLYTCVYVGMCTRVYVCVHACRGQKLIPGIVLNHSRP